MDPFEQSADMRLLDLQRKALGVKEPPRSNWSASHTDMNDAIPAHETPVPVLAGARLTVDLTANPSSKLIPGAVATVALAVHNESEADITGVHIAVPVPGEAQYRPGSLQLDRRALAESDADAFLGAGYVIAKLSAGQRVGFTWQLSVKAGTQPLMLMPTVRAGDAGVTGGAPIMLSRGAPATSAKLPQKYETPKAEPETPFYELDDDEARQFEHEDTLAAPPAREAPLVVMPDILHDEAAEAEVPAVAPEATEAAAVVEPAAAPANPRLYCTMDAASLGVVKKLFAAESFGQVPHYILQNSLACSLSGTGYDPGIRAHSAQQSGLLSRALLMRKLNKPMNVSDFSTGRIDFDLVPANQPADRQAPARLFMDLTPADVDFCAPVEQKNQLETFIRIRQLAVALQARHVMIDDDEVRTRAESLLDAYATAARAAINRTFIRAKLDRNFDPFGAADPAADKLAHELVDVLEAVITA